MSSYLVQLHNSLGIKNIFVTCCEETAQSFVDSMNKKMIQARNTANMTSVEYYETFPKRLTALTSQDAHFMRYGPPSTFVVAEIHEVEPEAF